MQITLVPFEGVSASNMMCLAEDLRRQHFDVSIVNSIDIPDKSYNRRRDQYMADRLLSALNQQPGERVLGVADIDIYRYVLKCVYGLADLPGRCALISLYRLHVAPNEKVFRARADKLAIHELGHTMGLEHCEDPECVMHFSTCLEDLDHTGMVFCEACRDKAYSDSWTKNFFN